MAIAAVPEVEEVVGKIGRVESPLDHDVTSGHLCIKGRFGWQFVQNRK